MTWGVVIIIVVVGNSPATRGRRHAEEAVALDLGHDLVLRDGRDDDAGAGERGADGEEECCSLHFYFIFLLFSPLLFVFLAFLLSILSPGR